MRTSNLRTIFQMYSYEYYARVSYVGKYFEYYFYQNFFYFLLSHVLMNLTFCIQLLSLQILNVTIDHKPKKVTEIKFTLNIKN